MIMKKLLLLSFIAWPFALHFIMPCRAFVGMPYNAPYVANATSFSYSSIQTLRRTSALTGVSDGKVASFSCWVKINGNDGQQITFFSISAGTATNAFAVYRDTLNRIQVFGSSGTSGTEVHSLNAVSTAGTFVADGAWHHLMVFVDLTDSAKRGVKWDGTNVTMTWTTYSNVNMQLSGDHPDVNYSEKYGGYGEI